MSYEDYEAYNEIRETELLPSLASVPESEINTIFAEASLERQEYERRITETDGLRPGIPQG